MVRLAYEQTLRNAFSKAGDEGEWNTRRTSKARGRRSIRVIFGARFAITPHTDLDQSQGNYHGSKVVSIRTKVKG